jgi:hypothetical protein
MEKRIITIDASPTQLRKLRKGDAVRIRKGTGFNLIVHPTTYHRVSRAFNSNKGVEVKLSPQEIQSNTEVSPEQHTELANTQNPDDGSVMAGKGIFGKKGDRLMKKWGIKKAMYQLGDDFKPMVKAGLSTALTAGSTALGASNPELLPYLIPGTMMAQGYMDDYLDNPDKYQGKSGRKHGRKMVHQAKHAGRQAINDYMNKEYGGNYDYLSKSGRESAVSNALSAKIAEEKQKHLQMYGYGLGCGIKERHSSIGRGAGMVSYMPPALVSQPLSANFQFQHFLPPQYQKYNEGMEGSGLYI